MASGIRILLPVLWLVLAECHIIDPLRTHFRVPTPRLPHFPKRPTSEENHVKKSADQEENQRPINGDVYSYNLQHYDRYYHDGYPMGMNPYEGYPTTFDLQSFHNMPGVNFGWPGITNEFNMPGPWNDRPGNGDGDNKKHKEKSSGEASGDDINDKPKKDDTNDKNKEPGSEKDDAKCDPIKNLEALPPKTNEIKNDKPENNTDLNAKKDYLLVDNNGNSVYLLHENVPNTNVMVPNINQPGGNNVLYLQQPGNQGYQLVNGQPQVNVPLAENKLDLNGYNNVVQNPVPNNSPNSNSYVLIYANGQLIQVPGVLVNSQQNNLPTQNGNQGSNVILNNPVPNNNINLYQNPNNVYTAVPNQGNQPSSNVAGWPNSNNVVYTNAPNQGIPNSNANVPVIQNPNNVVYAVPNQGIPNSNNPNNVVYSTVPNQGVPNSNLPVLQSPSNIVYSNVPNQGIPNSNEPIQNNVVYSNIPYQENPNSNALIPNPNNVIYYNSPVQGNQPNPMYVQVQNPPNLVNPNNIPNSNLGSYAVAPQPSVSVPNNVVNGYVPSNNGYQEPILNNLNGGINNPGISVQPAVPLPTNNNANIYQPLPAHEKDANAPVQNEPIENGNPQLAVEPTIVSIGIQPAIMVSGFKETDGDEKDKDKDNKKEKKEKKDKDKSKKKDKKKK